MAKKINHNFSASIKLNPEKGGAWLVVISLVDENMEIKTSSSTAWKNATAAKKYVKEMVKFHTPRKSIKLIPNDEKDAKGKPVKFVGELTFKA